LTERKFLKLAVKTFFKVLTTTHCTVYKPRHITWRTQKGYLCLRSTNIAVRCPCANFARLLHHHALFVSPCWGREALLWEMINNWMARCTVHWLVWFVSWTSPGKIERKGRVGAVVRHDSGEGLQRASR